ncbi:ATP-binding protein [Streptomyces abikoensis]|uniref:ATP-binding protein n=1 Tax=Streptomyces abikoensis TaxID=97398 RepID=UPI003710A6B4
MYPLCRRPDTVPHPGHRASTARLRACIRTDRPLRNTNSTTTEPRCGNRTLSRSDARSPPRPSYQGSIHHHKFTESDAEPFGYLNLDRKGAKLLFQIFTEREEGKATAVATNSPFTEWDKTFGDARLCAAIADRITFRCTLIQTGTESYRFQATQEALFPGQ